MNNKRVLSSLAMDLKRVAIGYHRGSDKMAERFLEEVMKRKDEIDTTTLKPYVRHLIDKLDNLVGQKETSRVAEDALMYSTLFQNAALKI